jgi:hypothetical protein
VVTKQTKGWHYSFVFDDEFGGYAVYEIYKTTLGGHLRTETPVFSIPGSDVEDAVRSLEHMIHDLKRNHVFKSVEKMDGYYNIGEEE